MSIAATIVSQCTVVRTGVGQYLGTDNTTTVNGMNETNELTASTSVPVTVDAAGRITLSSGSATLNLAAITFDADVGTLDTTGLKIQYAKFRNLSTNANAITIAKGASNGYTGFGSAFSVVIQPGGYFEYYGNESTADVASGVRTLDITGTGAQVLEVQIVAG